MAPLPTSKPSYDDGTPDEETTRKPLVERQNRGLPSSPPRFGVPSSAPVAAQKVAPIAQRENAPVTRPETPVPVYQAPQSHTEDEANLFIPEPEVETATAENNTSMAATHVSSTSINAPIQANEAEEYDEYEDYAERERREEIDALSDDAKENARRLLKRITDDESSEVLLNGPNEIMFKVNGTRYYDREIKFADIETYHSVINTLILCETDTKERIGSSFHLIEGQLELPDYENPGQPPLIARVHVIAPPVVKAAKVTIAKKAKTQFQIDDLQQRGAMSQQMAAFLKACARGRATVVFSGVSGSGKTTLLEAMSYHFDENDRAIVIEDTSELHLPLADTVYLLSTSRKPSQDSSEIVTLEWLVSQANRMRPDRIIVGEIRGAELAEFLSAANSGADGSMTTVHASSPRQTIEKMLSFAMKSPSAKNEKSVYRDIASTVQIIVQTARVDGRHVISQIEEISDTVLASGNGIATSPLFEFNRSTGQFTSQGRPTDSLQQFLGQRGVKVDPAWFVRGGY
jgi:pilus assembly protein CpaF